MPRFVSILVFGVLSMVNCAAQADDPPMPAAKFQAPQDTFPVHEEFWEAMSDEPSLQLGGARQSFLSVDLGAAAKRLRKAAANLRITSGQANATIKPQLNRSASELESLAHRVEKGEVKSVQELDQPSARALHRLSRHHYQMARRLWLQQRADRAGKQLRAAADNLEHAARLGRQEVRAATQTVVSDVRLVAQKLVSDVGYGIDEVGRGFENLGKQVESVGTAMESAQPISSRQRTLPRK